jgi:hypothetical protein
VSIMRIFSWDSAFVGARYRLYRSLVGCGHQAEIRASAGAHHDLGC